MSGFRYLIHFKHMNMEDQSEQLAPLHGRCVRRRIVDALVGSDIEFVQESKVHEGRLSSVRTSDRQGCLTPSIMPLLNAIKSSHSKVSTLLFWSQDLFLSKPLYVHSKPELSSKMRCITHASNLPYLLDLSAGSRMPDTL